ncbi:MAG: signal peptidase I [Actinomycetota bacterium]
METSGAEPSPSRTPPPPSPLTADDELRPSTPAKPERRHSFWRELPILIVVAFVVALVIKTFAVQAFYIPSASMEPTLVEGDRVLVEKVTYRFGEPGHGDVVVFEKDVFAPVPEEDESFLTDIADAFRSLFGFPTGTSQDFIKRVIAVEGDTVEGRDGRVYVNGEPIEEPYLPDGTDTSPFGPVQVGDAEVFVMGDNRANSDDSRNFGPVPADSIVGHAFLLIWPPSDFDTL